MLYPLVNKKAEFRMAVPASNMQDVTLEWMRQELSNGCQYAFEYFERTYDDAENYYDDADGDGDGDGDGDYGHTYW